MELASASEGINRVDYGIGRPVSESFLKNVNDVIFGCKPEGCIFEPVIEPGINFISAGDIVDGPDNPLREVARDEVAELLDASLEETRNRVECAYILKGLGLKLNRYRVQDRGNLGINLRMGVLDWQIQQTGARFWQLSEEKRALRRSLGFPITPELKRGKRPEYWVNLGSFVAKDGIGASGIKEAIVPSLPRSPRFGGTRILNRDT